MEQLRDNLSTFETELTLSPQEQQAIQQTVAELLKAEPVPCTGCEYCMPCPFGVDIPEVFQRYNNYKLFENKARTYQAYFEQLKPFARADQCRSCGKCMQACPQKLQIPALLAKAHTELLQVCAAVQSEKTGSSDKA